MKTVLITENNILALEGLNNILNSEEGINAVGFDTGYKSIDKLNEMFSPDIIVVGLEGNLVEVAESIKKINFKNKDVKFIAMVNKFDDYNISDIINSGFSGYIVKTDKEEKVLSIVKEVIAGNYYINGKATTVFLEEYFKLDARVKRLEMSNKFNSIDVDDILSPREINILQLMSNGLNNSKISKELFIAQSTVRNHVNNIFKKLQVKTRTEAVITGIKHGWIKLS